LDLHFTSATASPPEREAVDALLGKDDDWSGKAARDRRHLLLPALHAVQERIGWISGGALNYVCERLGVPPADAYGVATFYEMFSTKPLPPLVAHVCDDIACMGSGAKELCDAMEAAFGPAGTAAASGTTTWLRSPCLGMCERAPAALVTAASARPVAIQLAPTTTAELQNIVGNAVPAGAPPPPPHVGGTELRLLKRIAAGIDPSSLDAYRANGGYHALERAFELGSGGVIAEVTASKLLGRGGAAFPAGRKLDAVAQAAATPHYIVCNADESEPGTFKDRILMENDPFAIVEAMTIAAVAARAEFGFIYIRGEYPLATQRLQHAIDTARAAKLLGDDVMGRGFGFDIEIRRGAGAYICGEETALFNSIEGKRGEPRSKPPFPVNEGLFHKPTSINNVETLANLPLVLADGGEAYAHVGTEGSTGTRLFCLSGAIAQPGLYEVAHGTTVAAVIEMAGGVPAGHTLQAILLGGAAGTFAGPEALEMPLSFEGARAAGATLGSGVLMLFDERTVMLDILKRIARFFRDESCGQCVPCRIGTVRQEEALEASAIDVNLIDEIGRAMRDASICGLGQAAYSAIESAQRSLKVLAPEGAR
jgi:NADH-quinone oxidoreductase subunit F